MTHCDDCQEVGAEAAGLSLSLVALLLDMCSVMFGCTCKVVDFFRFFVFVVSVCLFLFVLLLLYASSKSVAHLF